jgi:2-methylisocitrate lyase-like PEP mutase family enzyme
VSGSSDRRARFAELHAQPHVFVMPNPWDIGSARLLAAAGFDALATTSAGFAWALGKLDQQVTRDELVGHVEQVANATSVPLNVDSERCYPEDAGGISETVRLLGDAGAAGFSIEDYDPATERIDDVEVALAHLKEALEASRTFDPPLVVTARAENHIRGVDDFEDTLRRVSAYSDAGADVVYAPGLSALADIERVVGIGVPVNVLAIPDAPPLAELERVGVRRISTGSLLASAAYGALVAAATELCERGTSDYTAQRLSRDIADAAFRS